ncbi:GNAT family N-acetyltransferase [Gulosibacter bifidus]|uniref:GNAT family N-acetyltransferase n=1 Tax=Gulosibacter bifidus TaxID=272239 RepID=A0ABW5RHL1_9MICO|nr:GNAT family N-acetyltransferase [Gulosibacter bifidus]
MTIPSPATANPSESNREVQLADGRRIHLKHDPEATTFAAEHNGQRIGVADYVDAETDRIRAFTHTEVNPEFQGTGIASKLVELAVRTSSRDGYDIDPQCSYVHLWLRRHPEFAHSHAPATNRGNNGASDLPKGTR